MEVCSVRWGRTPGHQRIDASAAIRIMDEAVTTQHLQFLQTSSAAGCAIVGQKRLRNVHFRARNNREDMMPPKTIPDKLPGVVCAQYIRCGKPNCRCARGELHGPFYYRFWRDHNGRQHKVYVRKADLEKVRNACEARQREQEEVREYLAKGPRALRWLATGETGLSEDADPMKQFERVCELNAVVHHLMQCATGKIGAISQCARAAGLILSMENSIFGPRLESGGRTTERSAEVLALLRGTKTSEEWPDIQA